MTEVKVFVDDAVNGNLPRICVKSGLPADTSMTYETQVGSSNDWRFLLLFLGPIGWIIFFLTSPGREFLTTEMPYTSGVLRERREHSFRRFAAWGAGVVLFLAGFLSAGEWPLLWIAGLAAIAYGALEHLRVAKLEVDISLDGSRRWVTLSGVHPNFAAAIAPHHESYEI